MPTQAHGILVRLDAKANEQGILLGQSLGLLQVGVESGRVAQVTARETGHTHRVYEPGSALVDGDDAFVGRVGGDEKHEIQTIGRCCIAEMVALLRGEVRQDETVDPCLSGVLTERLDAVLQDGVDVAHEQDRGLALLPEGRGGLEGVGERDAVREGLGAGPLNGASLGQGIAERHAQLDEVGAPPVNGVQERHGGVRMRKAIREKEPHGLLVAAA